MVYKINWFLVLFIPLNALAQVLLRGIRFFDGEEVFECVDLKIDGEIIQHIGTPTPAVGDSVVDGSGLTLIPGLINSHVHAFLPYHLKNAFEHGVLAVLDMHASAEIVATLRSYELREGYAAYYSCISAATVAKGHGTQFGFTLPTVGDSLSPSDFVKWAHTRGADYIKIIYEPKLRTLSKRQVKELIEASYANGLKAVVHVGKLSDAKEFADYGVAGLVHLWNDKTANTADLKYLKEQGVFVIATATTLEAANAYYESVGRKTRMLPLDCILFNIKSLHDAGIPLLAGTDAPNFMLDYGSSLHRELELFVSAGLTPLEAIRTATTEPAKSFDLREFGKLKEGRPAHFLLIKGNPLKDISHLKNIHSIWVDGKIIKNYSIK